MLRPTRSILGFSAVNVDAHPKIAAPHLATDFIENIARKQSKKAKEALEWYGGPYDPDNLDEEPDQHYPWPERKFLPNRAIKTRQEIMPHGPARMPFVKRTPSNLHHLSLEQGLTMLIIASVQAAASDFIGELS